MKSLKKAVKQHVMGNYLDFLVTLLYVFVLLTLVYE